MDDGMRLWIYKTARLNVWRVYPLLSFDDLVSEGLLVYSKVRHRYPKAQSAPAIMSLLVVAYRNHIHNLADKRRRTISAWAIDDVPGLMTKIESTPDLQAELAHYLIEAPPNIHRAISACAFSAKPPPEVLTELRAYLQT